MPARRAGGPHDQALAVREIAREVIKQVLIAGLSAAATGLAQWGIEEWKKSTKPAQPAPPAPSAKPRARRRTSAARKGR